VAYSFFCTFFCTFGKYDACPSSLTFDFPAEEEGLQLDRTDLVLLPCKLDLRGDRIPTCTSAKFEIWNENGKKYSGAYQCISGSFENYLDAIQPSGHGSGGDKFTYKVLKTDMGHVRITGSKNSACDNAPYLVSPSCKEQQQTSPFIGVKATFDEHFGATASTPMGSGGNATGFIKWDLPSPPPPTTVK
jgi:hypothetical protein